MSLIARIKGTKLINAPMREHPSLFREAKFFDLKPSHLPGATHPAAAGSVLAGAHLSHSASDGQQHWLVPPIWQPDGVPTLADILKLPVANAKLPYL